MKKEHYQYVCNHLGLKQYNLLNNPNNWNSSYEGAATVDNLSIEYNIIIQSWVVVDNDVGMIVFCGLPDEETALEVLKHITETEVLFI